MIERGDTMKKINVVQLIGSLFMLVGCIVNLIRIFIDIFFWIEIIGLACMVIGLIIQIILLVQMRKQRKQ